MSDTPRTDAAAMEGDTTVVVDTDFARQLERESDALRREKMQFMELYKLMPDIENQYEDRLLYHLANKLHQLAAAQKEIEQLKNNTPSCGACAEALWTGSVMHPHTCAAMRCAEILSTWIEMPENTPREALEIHLVEAIKFAGMAVRGEAIDSAIAQAKGEKA